MTLNNLFKRRTKMTLECLLNMIIVVWFFKISIYLQTWFCKGHHISASITIPLRNLQFSQLLLLFSRLLPSTPIQHPCSSIVYSYFRGNPCITGLHPQQASINVPDKDNSPITSITCAPRTSSISGNSPWRIQGT
jgi:hypothetical protein